MICKFCSKTMQSLGADNRRTSWCPSCGALYEKSGDLETWTPPALLERCRLFQGHFASDPAYKTLVELWRSDGINEAIWPEKERAGVT